MKHKGIWGTICEDFFDKEEAKVVCRMLGFPSSNARIYDKTTNFDGKGPVWIRFKSAAL